MLKIRPWMPGILMSVGYIVALSVAYYYLANRHVEIPDTLFFTTVITVHLIVGFVLFRLWPCTALCGLILTPAMAVVWGVAFYITFGREIQIVDEGIGLHIMLVTIIGLSVFIGALGSAAWEKSMG